MQIDNVELSTDSNTQTLSADISWASFPDRKQKIWFSSPQRDFRIRRHATPFLLAAGGPAMVAGETKLAVSEPVDQIAYVGLSSALAILKNWCGDLSGNWNVPRLEAAVGNDAPGGARHIASFYSGGVDATFTLLRNHASFPDGHEARIKTVMAVYGFDLGHRDYQADLPVFNEYIDQVARVLQRRGVCLVPVYTNLRQLDPRPGYWGRVYAGLALSAVAQLFPDHFHQVMVGTAGERLNTSVQSPSATHPIIHHYTDTEATQVHSPYVEFSRLQRIGEIIEHGDLAGLLRVCFNSSLNSMNCGKCEKCVRTRVAIHLLGGDAGKGFNGPALSPDLIESAVIDSQSASVDHEELLESLLERQEIELARSESRILKRWYRHRAWKDGTSYRQRIKRKLISIRDRFTG